MKTVEEHLNTVEKRMGRLEGRMDALSQQVALMREDINRILDGTDEEPGVNRKLDRLDDIVRLLEERLPKPEGKAAG